MRRCVKCNNSLDAISFTIRKTICDDCVFRDRREYYLKNKENILKRSAGRYVAKKETILFSNAKRYLINKDKYNKQKREYYQNNSEKFKLLAKEYRQSHKDLTRKWGKEWEQQRKQNDPAYKLRKNITRLVSHHLFKTLNKKSRVSILSCLGYSFEELKLHLEKQFEPWMNWDNYGKYNIKTWDDNNSATWTWQLDHIIPQAKLSYTSMEDDNFQKCWALENLRPLGAKQNLIKGAR